MLPTSNGGDTNGHHQIPSGMSLSHRDKQRKARRLSGEDVVSDDATPPCTDFDVAYFHSYAHLGIHEEMIKDHVRTDTYRNAIFKYQHLIAGKVVVDVGCGTGILSIFCAQAGAKRVYAVDASGIAVQATEVIKANNLTDIVKVLHGRVEDVDIDEEADVIISEWMGYMLFYESMLGSVIIARDRWLKPGGLILPSHATLYLAPVTNPDRYSHSIDFWRNVYGIDMSAMVPLAKQCAFEEPSVEIISAENVLTWPHVVKYVDCYTVTAAELETISSKFKLFSMMREFDCVDANLAKLSLVMRSIPKPATLIYFFEPIEVEQDQLIEGSIALTQSKENRRFMNIHFEYTCRNSPRSLSQNPNTMSSEELQQPTGAGTQSITSAKKVGLFDASKPPNYS
ncbi:hypothetical protein KSS87_006571 [Heliosperma pusillum]|nr:hypothetical protein KSS87_006571 [Heliosperma pusillum]